MSVRGLPHGWSEAKGAFGRAQSRGRRHDDPEGRQVTLTPTEAPSYNHALTVYRTGRLLLLRSPSRFAA